MAKKAKASKLTLESLAERITKVEQGVEEIRKAVSTSAEVELPDLKGLKKLDDAQVEKLAASLNINTKGKKAKAVRALVATVIAISTGKGEDVEDDALDALLDAVAIKKPKKSADKLAKLEEYFEVEGAAHEDEDEAEDDDEEDDDESDDDEEDDEDDEDEDEEEDDDESDDDEEDDEDDEDEESDDEDEEDSDDEDEEEDDEEESDDEDDEESGDEDEDEDDDEDEDEESDDDEEEEESEVSSKEQKKRLAEYNKVAKKKLKSYGDLEKLLKDSNGEIAEWGKAYERKGQSYCCGVPTKDTKIKGDKRDITQCQVTGKLFTVEEDEFVEVKAKAKKK